MKIITQFFTQALLFLVLIFCGSNLLAQNQPVSRDQPFLRTNVTIKEPSPKKDTIISKKDTLRKDTTKLKTDTVALKQTGLQSEVEYSADDSIKFDKIRKLVYLYGNARVKYEGFELSAGYIQLDQVNSTVTSYGSKDPKSGRKTGRPIFKQSDDTPKLVDSLVYNYQTKKGKAVGVSTEVEGGYLQAERFKKNEYDEGSFRDGRFSTCNLPFGHQHFYIAIKKGIVFEKQIVTGPAYMVIEDVPMPAIIPFGFFPKVGKRSSGVLFPTFGEEAARGFYMRDLGYYIGLNDYWDAEVRGSLYSKGSYAASLLARYNKNYKFGGNINFNFASNRTGIEGTPGYKPDKEFSIQWSHSQRNEANPGTTFGASVNIATAKYFSSTAAGGTYSVPDITRNNLNSSISYGKTFGIFNFTSALTHSQDLQASTVSLTLPSFNLNMNSINPFDSKNSSGEQTWYQKITVGYTLSGSNSITIGDSLLFKKETLNKFTNGFQHNIPLSYSQTIFKFFQFSLSVPYSEGWTLKSIRKNYDPTSNTIVTDTISGFKRVFGYSFGGNLSTKIYGQVNFKKGRTVAIRHIMTPTIGMSYTPDFGKERYGFYKMVQSDNTGKNFQRYSIFEGSPVSTPGFGTQGSINFGLDNTIEAKRRTSNDTTNAYEKIPLIQGLSFSGNYNLAADSFKLSTIGFSARTALFKQKLGLNFNGTLDPYAINNLGNRVNRYAIGSGTLARLTSLSFSTEYSFNSNAAKSRNNTITQANQNRASMTPTQADDLSRISRDPNAFVDFKIPWNINMSYSFNYSKEKLTAAITNTFNFSGSLAVTPQWQVQYNSGYDFQRKKLSITTFSIYRDLHCWDLSFHWVPSGPYQSYSVDLKVKASILQDLKLSRRRDYFNFR